MSFTYTDPSASRRDAIRFIIGDTKSVDHLLEDAEIDWIIDQNEFTNKQIAVAFRQMATAFAIKPDRRKLGPQEESASQRLAYFKAMASKYERELNYTGLPPLPEYQADPVFEKGMMENV
jgi:hypothetical protein